MVVYAICAKLIIGVYAFAFWISPSLTPAQACSIPFFSWQNQKEKDVEEEDVEKQTNKKNKAKHKVSSSKFTHFPRICFVRSAYYSHKFRQLQMAQPLNRIYFTKNHEIWCIRSKHNISLIYPTSGWFYRRLTLLTLWFLYIWCVWYELASLETSAGIWLDVQSWMSSANIFIRTNACRFSICLSVFARNRMSCKNIVWWFLYEKRCEEARVCVNREVPPLVHMLLIFTFSYFWFDSFEFTLWRKTKEIDKIRRNTKNFLRHPLMSMFYRSRDISYNFWWKLHPFRDCWIYTSYTDSITTNALFIKFLFSFNPLKWKRDLCASMKDSTILPLIYLLRRILPKPNCHSTWTNRFEMDLEAPQ